MYAIPLSADYHLVWNWALCAARRTRRSTCWMQLDCHLFKLKCEHILLVHNKTQTKLHEWVRLRHAMHSLQIRLGISMHWADVVYNSSVHRKWLWRLQNFARWHSHMPAALLVLCTHAFLRNNRCVSIGHCSSGIAFIWIECYCIRSFGDLSLWKHIN